MRLPSFIAVGVLAAGVTPATADIVRADLRVASDDDLSLHLRQVVHTARSVDRGPVLLVHGARVGSVASFDVDVPGFSLAEDLATAGHSVYLADIRGYGFSEFPPSMAGDRFATPPAVPTAVAVRDLKVVLEAVAERHPGKPIGALGWATGSHWLAATEAAHPGSIARLIFYNSVYGGVGDWRLTEVFSHADAPGELNFAKFGAYRMSTAESLVGRWTNAKGISEAFIDRYVTLAMAGDPTAGTRTPPSFRHPSGPISDTLAAVHDGPIYDAAQIRSDVLTLRSGNDFWSRPVDVTTFRDDLASAASVTITAMENASHYVHLEPGDGRRHFLDIVTGFLAQPPTTAIN